MGGWIGKKTVHLLTICVLVCFVAKGWAGGVTISQPAYGFFIDLIYIMKQGLAPVEWDQRLETPSKLQSLFNTSATHPRKCWLTV